MTTVATEQTTRLTPAGWVLLLIAGTGLIRLGLAAAVGLGIDETYMVAAGRHFHLGYFDHPPASWWLSWAATQIFQTNAPAAVRLPFILLFALSTWLLYRLTARLYGPTAGLWAAVTLNLSPVFSITTGGWVLPDGPLDCALLGMVLCLTHALEDTPKSRQWWLATGLCAGAALFSKYLAALTILGAFAALLTQPTYRRWLRCPDPWLAALIALAAFTPVILWNATHGWASFLFQGGRAGATRLHPFAPLEVLGGEALFVLPWIWLPLVACLLKALRAGPSQRPDWLLANLALPPIALFVLVSLWSPRILFHWAAPGYLMLFPLLGRAIAEAVSPRRLHLTLLATAALLIAGITILVSELTWPWLPASLGAQALRDQAASWRPLAAALDSRGLGGLTLAGIRWHECGKLDYALGTDHTVLCLTPDAREFTFATNPANQIGYDILLIAPHTDLTTITRQLGGQFKSIEELPPLNGIPLFLGREYKGEGK